MPCKLRKSVMSSLGQKISEIPQFCGFEDIYQQIFPSKFHKNLTLPGQGGVDSIFESAYCLLL